MSPRWAACPACKAGVSPQNETLVQVEGSLQMAISKRPAGLAYRPAGPEVLFQEAECVCCGGPLSGAMSFLIEAQNS